MTNLPVASITVTSSPTCRWNQSHIGKQKVTETQGASRGLTLNTKNRNVKQIEKIYRNSGFDGNDDAIFDINIGNLLVVSIDNGTSLDQELR